MKALLPLHQKWDSNGARIEQETPKSDAEKLLNNVQCFYRSPADAIRRAAALSLTKLDEMSWGVVKQTVLAKFSKPKLLQDYFDEILRFQIGVKETASEAALRLWNLIERIPKTVMPEEVVTGFVIFVLCQKDNLIRRELIAHNITTRTQLFRILGGVSLKRRSDGVEANEPEAKRFRATEGFTGRCNFCGISGLSCGMPKSRCAGISRASRPPSTSRPWRK
ncbi:unnamed protein product [Leptosia nina]|uniref:Uncharacterized protein n=1 Tax=Leptosia nina TaxID=320188 RepID=A0AAV1J4F7_9NEOP